MMDKSPKDKHGKKSQEDIEKMMDCFKSWKQIRLELEETNEWKKDNMEYDLRSTKWICDKAKASEAYAQNLYAAICNNDFIRNDVWPILSEKKWTASWRSAGEIVANMIEQGDYIDWYCSGIVGEVSDEKFNEMNKEQQEIYLYHKNNFVQESVVTDEIRHDLLKLGWIVIHDNDEH